MERERRIRPVLWVVGGALALLIGLMMAYSAAAAAIRVGDAHSAAVCTTDFSSGCTTERAAVLEQRLSVRGSWLTQEQKWLARVPDGAPDLKTGALLKLEVPRQEGSWGLTEGAEVTVIYYSRAPAWIRPASGVVLETGMHPRRYAPTVGWMALFAIGAGTFAMQTGVRAGRAEGVWLRRTTAEISPGIAGVMFVAGMFGSLGQLVGGGTLWPGVVAGLVGAMVGVVVSFR